MIQQQTYFLELYRAGVRATSDIAKASLENAQRLQAQQAEALREAIEANSRASRELAEAKSLTDLMALQLKLAGTQAERAADFWTRALRTASETQVAILGQVQNAVNNGVDAAREATQRMAA